MFMDCSLASMPPHSAPCWSIATPELTEEEDTDRDGVIGRVRLKAHTDTKVAPRGLPWLPGHWQLQDNPTGQVTVGLACAGMILGLRLATAMGLGRVRPPLVAVASALLAAGGSLSCCAAACAVKQSGETVELSIGTLACLAWLCGTLEALPLAPLSKAAVEGVAGPVRLALPGVVGTVVMFELAHRYWAHINPANVLQVQEQSSSQGSGLGDLDALGQSAYQAILRLWKSHFLPDANGSRGVGTAFLGMHLAGSFFSTNVDLAMTQWKKTFFNTLQAKDLLGFKSQLVDFGFIAAVSTLISVYSGYLTMIWDLKWREEVTKDFIGTLVEHRSAQQQSQAAIGDEALDNIDQRIAEDTGMFATHSRSLLCGATESVVRLVVFFPALVRLSPSPHIWQVCLGLSLASSFVTHLVGAPLASRNAALQRSEADFRTALMRLRLFPEDSVAAESTQPIEYFETVKAATWLAARSSLNLSAFTSAYSLTSTVLPFLILAPSYFSGSISLGTMFQIEGLIGGVQGSLDFFIGAYGDIAVWQAATRRLLTLEASLKSAPLQSPLPESTVFCTEIDEDGVEELEEAARGIDIERHEPLVSEAVYLIE